MTPVLLVRADAHVSTGTGHIMRNLALAQAWQDAGGRAFFACRFLPDSLRQRLDRENIGVIVNEAVDPGSAGDAEWTAKVAHENNALWVSVDGYGFDSFFLESLSTFPFRVLAFDDYGHFGRYRAYIILNSNVTAREDLYHDRNADCTLLLGTRFAPLRREFIAARQRSHQKSTGRPSLLVTMGGADPDNITERILDAMGSLPKQDLNICVVVGAGNPHFEKLEASIQRLSQPFRILRDVQNMADLMAESDMAITAGGSTYLEALCMRLACLIFILADNQVASAHELAHLKAVALAGDARTMSTPQIGMGLSSFLGNFHLQNTLRQSASAMVDGLGAQRVARAMLQG